MPKGGIRPICCVANCGRPHRGKGFCGLHYGRFLVANAPKCSVVSCEKPSEKRGLCGAHYFRLRVHGDPLAGGTSPGTGALFYENVVLRFEGDECLPWPLPLCNGYPWLNRYKDRTDVYVTRQACEDKYGPPPTPEHEAAHNCGHSKCCNPSHLRWATPAENAADKLRHGTHAFGDKSPASKLSGADVRQIRLLKGHISQKTIGAMFGVTASAIHAIFTGKTWAHLIDE